MNNVRKKFSLSFIMLVVLLMSFGSVFALTDASVYLTVKDANGTVLKPDSAYEFKAGDKIYVTAYSNNEEDLYWAQNSLWMQERGYKANDKGMALLGYGFDIKPLDASPYDIFDIDGFISSSDPTQLTITVPNFAENSMHTLKIQGLSPGNYGLENSSQHSSFKINIYMPEPKITEYKWTAHVTAKDANGTVLKTDGTYEFKAGDKIYVTAYCDYASSIKFSQDSLWMQGQGNGAKVNDKGMALLGYGFGNLPLVTESPYDISDIDGFIISPDPTQLTITVPDFAEGSTHTLKIQGFSTSECCSEMFFPQYKLKINIKVPKTTITETITKVNDTTLKVTATVANGTFSKIVYNWDGGSNQESASNPLNITIPSFAAGSTHTLTATAYTTNGKTATKTYTVTMPAAVTPETTISASISKTNDTTLKVTATVANGTFSKIVYNWDGGTNQESASNPLNITIPNFAAGSTHTLTATAYTTNGKTATKTYTITIPKEEVIDDEPVVDDEPVIEEDELIIESWMREDSTAEGLLVSLRNDTEEDKANKNFYKLKEEVIYYVDYKNCDKDIENEVKLILTLPLEFEVVQSDGGTVSKADKTITWTFANGLEREQAGTKEVIIKYTKLSKSSYDYEIVYPYAEIYNASKKKDTSAVINYIYLDEDTEIADKHEPYMYGDKEKPTFRPDSTITRAEGALVLARIFEINASNVKVTDSYSDIGETYLEAQQAITVATNLGIINGYEDGTYRPKNKMTRAEFMKVIASYIEVLGEEEGVDGLEVKNGETIKVYKNTANRNHWAVPYVTLLARLNMTSVSSSEKDLRLEDEITRAEVAQLVNFYLLRAPARVTSSTKTQFSDVSRSHKLFADIVEATRDAHTYTITDNGEEKAK